MGLNCPLEFTVKPTSIRDVKLKLPTKSAVFRPENYYLFIFLNGASFFGFDLYHYRLYCKSFLHASLLQMTKRAALRTTESMLAGK